MTPSLPCATVIRSATRAWSASVSSQTAVSRRSGVQEEMPTLSREILEMEGLHQWVPPQLDGYASPFAAVERRDISVRW